MNRTWLLSSRIVPVYSEGVRTSKNSDARGSHVTMVCGHPRIQYFLIPGLLLIQSEVFWTQEHSLDSCLSLNSLRLALDKTRITYVSFNSYFK